MKGVWRHSRRDFILFTTAVAQFAATTWWALHYQSFSLTGNLAIYAALALVFYFNPIVVTHNFLHCPFFRADWANRAFAVFNSANLSLPQILYKHHHLLHHRYANDPVRNGTTLDPSSTFRHGRKGRQEHFVPYSAFSLFRDGTTFAYREVQRKGENTQFLFELLASVAGAAFWLVLSWKWFLVWYLPLFYVGWFLAHVENYFEHHHATDPDQRYADSVSYYGRFYNVFMFNEGYHQEHHIHPGQHWSRRPSVNAQYGKQLENAKAHRAKFPPLLGFLDTR